MTFRRLCGVARSFQARMCATAFKQCSSGTFRGRTAQEQWHTVGGQRASDLGGMSTWVYASSTGLRELSVGGLLDAGRLLREKGRARSAASAQTLARGPLQRDGCRASRFRPLPARLRSRCRPIRSGCLQRPATASLPPGVRHRNPTVPRPSSLERPFVKRGRRGRSDVARSDRNRSPRTRAARIR